MGSAIKEYLQAQPNNMLCEISHTMKRYKELHDCTEMHNSETRRIVCTWMCACVPPSLTIAVGAEAINPLWTILFSSCAGSCWYVLYIYTLLKVHDRHSSLQSVLTYNSGEEGVSLCCTHKVYIALYQKAQPTCCWYS